MAPRPAVEVVRADREPLVVDDAHLGVHVDRDVVLVDAGRTRRPVGRRRPRACASRCGDRSHSPARRSSRPGREAWDDDDDPESGRARARRRAPARRDRTRGTGPRGTRAGGRGRTRGGRPGRCCARRAARTGTAAGAPGRCARSASRTGPTAAGRVGSGRRARRGAARWWTSRWTRWRQGTRRSGGSGRSIARRTCRRRPRPPDRAARAGGRATAVAGRSSPPTGRGTLRVAVWRGSSWFPWLRSIPPTNATSSRPGLGAARTTTFWWRLPSRRMRLSSRTSPPAALTTRANSRFVPRCSCGWDRHTRPLTATPRRSSSTRSPPSRTPSPRSRSASTSSPARSTRSRGRVARHRRRQSKYAAPSMRTSAALPVVHARLPRPASMPVAGLPRCSARRNQSVASAGMRRRSSHTRAGGAGAVGSGWYAMSGSAPRPVRRFAPLPRRALTRIVRRSGLRQHRGVAEQVIVAIGATGVVATVLAALDHGAHVVAVAHHARDLAALTEEAGAPHRFETVVVRPEGGDVAGHVAAVTTALRSAPHLGAHRRPHRGRGVPDRYGVGHRPAAAPAVRWGHLRGGRTGAGGRRRAEPAHADRPRAGPGSCGRSAPRSARPGVGHPRPPDRHRPARPRRPDDPPGRGPAATRGMRQRREPTSRSFATTCRACRRHPRCGGPRSHSGAQSCLAICSSRQAVRSSRSVCARRSGSRRAPTGASGRSG